VPVDHKIFEELNSAQWLWYYHNFAKDEEEKFESNRDFIEYLAGFIEPQAVQKIRELRNRNSGTGGKTVSVDDNSFTKGIEQIFGRKLKVEPNQIGATNSENNAQKVDSGLDVTEIIKNMPYLQKPKDPSLNYRHWAYLDLE
jgi:hypothetical protein